MAKLSDTLRHRVEETQDDITALEGRQAALSHEKAVLLAAPTVDLKAVRKLEEEEARIPTTIASLHDRIALLREQLEAAEASEAQERIAAIESEYAALSLILKAQHKAWLEGLEQLAHILEQSPAMRGKLQLLQDEGAYLVERFGTRWPHLEPAPFPSRGDIAKKLESSLQKASWILHAANIWQERAAEIRKAKNALAHKEAEEQRASARSQSMVRMSTPAFTPGKVH